MSIKKKKRLLGIVLLLVGAALAFWGYQMAGSFGGQFTKMVSGSIPDKVMIRYLGGAVCAGLGTFLILK
jgi:hypothetical protein